MWSSNRCHQDTGEVEEPKLPAVRQNLGHAAHINQQVTGGNTSLTWGGEFRYRTGLKVDISYV